MDLTFISFIFLIPAIASAVYICYKSDSEGSNSGGAPPRSPIEIPPLREVDDEPPEDDYDRGHHSDSSEERRRGRAKNKNVCEPSDYHNQCDIDDRGGDGGGD